MSLQDQLRGMLYSGKTVSHQNATIYMSKGGKKIAIKEAVTEYDIASFMKAWKESKSKLIDSLSEKLKLEFDYVFNKDGSVLLYLKPEDAKSGYNEIDEDDVIDYKSEGEIRITPYANTKENTIAKVAVQSKFDVNGEDYNKRTLEIVAPNIDMDSLIKQITNNAYTLSKNLNIV